MDNILEAHIAIDAFLLLQSKLSPEEIIDRELAEVKKAMLEKFYERFPEKRK